MLYIYFSFIVAYFTLYFCGYFLKVLLLNDDIKKYDIFITPWLGAGLIILTLYSLSWLGFSVRSSVNYFTLSVVGCNAAVYLKFREGVCFDRKDAIAAAAAGFITATLYGGLLAAHDFAYYAFSSNTDFSSYLNAARAALISSAKFVRLNPEGIPHWYVIDLSLNYDFRGCVFVYAFFSALYNQSLLRVMYIVSAFAMFLNVMTFRLFLKDTEHTPVLCALLCVLSFNSFFQRLIFQAFFGQLFSVGIVMAAFFTGLYLSERAKFDLRSCLLLVFTLTANSLNYIEAMAYPIVPFVAFGFASLIRGKEGWKPYWKNMVFAGSLFALLNLMPIYNFFALFRRFRAIFPGWATYMATLADVSGLQGAFASPNLQFAALLISNALLIPVILCQMKREGFSSFLSISCVSYILLYIAFCAMFFSLGDKSSYNAFKGALSMSFILVILILRFLERDLNGIVSLARGLRVRGGGSPAYPPIREWITAGVFILFFSLNAAATGNNLRRFYMTEEGGLDRDGDIISAYAESGEYAESDFIINSDSRNHQLSAAYHAPWGRTYTSGYGGVDGDSERAMKDFIKPGDIYATLSMVEDAFNTSDGVTLFENGTYRISRLGSSSLLVSDYGGFHHTMSLAGTPRGRKMVRRVNDGAIEFEIMSLAEKSADITLTFFDPMSAAQEITAFVGKEKFDPVLNASDEFIEAELRGVPLNGGKNYLRLMISGDVSMMSLAGFKLKNY
ncbi:MAG: hypothetical protein LBS53_08830 [Synergistaceae bacterium]|nr:hypothetical protein [Synergistaceae bacterium]